MTGSRAWSATVRLRADRPELVEWVERSLSPEAAREVPRATARVSRPGAGEIELAIEADDAGALRAALNTYLGWVDLSLATARVAASRAGPTSP